MNLFANMKMVFTLGVVICVFSIGVVHCEEDHSVAKVCHFYIHSNKVGYTATLVAGGWAWAVMEKVSGAFGQEQ